MRIVFKVHYIKEVTTWAFHFPSLRRTLCCMHCSKTIVSTHQKDSPSRAVTLTPISSGMPRYIPLPTLCRIQNPIIRPRKSLLPSNRRFSTLRRMNIGPVRVNRSRFCYWLVLVISMPSGFRLASMLGMEDITTYTILE